MKKILHISMLFMALTICLQLSAILRTPVNLPQTMSIANQYVYIDVNGDGIGDFIVQFVSNLNGSFCEIQAPEAPGSSSPALGVPSYEINKILYEDVTAIGYFTAILNQGDPVGSAGLWYDNANIFRKSLSSSPPPPLASNYTNGAHHGFIGIHYSIPSGGGMYYGWLPVQIASDGQSVIIGQGGSGTAPEQSVQAGIGGSAVPFPLIASILGFGFVGGGIFLKRRKK